MYGQARPDTLIMASGGLDSMVLAYQAASENDLHGIYYQLDRPAQIGEIGCLNLLSADLNIPIERVDIRELDKSFYGHLPYELLCSDSTVNRDWPRLAARQVALGGLASLLTLSAFYAHAINVDRVALGVHDTMVKLVPEFREFLDRQSDTLHILQNAHPRIEFDTPFLTMTKAEIVGVGNELSVPFEKSWSCGAGGESHCGKCHGCEERRLAFEQAGVEDVTIYME